MRKTLVFLAFTVLLLGYPSLVLGAEQSFVWRGDKGYRVEIYLPAPGENSFENSENFVFIDPQGKRFAQYPKSLTNPYFQLHLSRENRRLAGDLDVGGEKPGEYFLKGRVGGILELVQVLAPGREVVVDRGREWEESEEREERAEREEWVEKGAGQRKDPKVWPMFRRLGSDLFLILLTHC